MAHLKAWDGREIEIATSAGGVIAVTNPWNNLVCSGVRPWPAPELIQKAYQSRQTRAFKGEELERVTATFGFYSDLQSIHSEDAITWSFFGPIVYSDSETRNRYVKELFDLIGIAGSQGNASVWLWRRLPHPDTLVSGGPEIDFGIQTDNVFLLGEAKWRSPVGARQGVSRNKDQLTLRQEFCDKYGRRLLPNVQKFGVLGIDSMGGMLSDSDSTVDGVTLHLRSSTWDALATINSHPCAEELRCYLKWKGDNTKDR